MPMEYTIGTKFETHHKPPTVATVVDILKTYNAAGELVRVRYVAQYERLGQLITDRDVVAVSIAKRILQPQRT